MIYLKLFFSFLWIGVFSFGGGYGGIPLIREVTLNQGWLTDETLSRMIAVSESTPGPVMVNLASYVGYVQGGLAGAVLATAAVVLPAFVIIMLVVSVCKMAMKHPGVRTVLEAMQPCAVGIILATGIYMTLEACVPAGTMDWKAWAIGLVLLFLSHWGKKVLKLKKKIGPIHLILVAAVMGIVLYGF